MAVTGKQFFLCKRILQSLCPASRWRCSLKYLVVLPIILVSLACSSDAQAGQCLGQPVEGKCSPNQFYSSTSSCCIQCTNCSALNTAVLYQCNATQDATCIPSCPNPELQHWSLRDNTCIITDCTKCEGGDCISAQACRCLPCHTGPTCTQLEQTDECREDIDINGNGREIVHA